MMSLTGTDSCHNCDDGCVSELLYFFQFLWSCDSSWPIVCALHCVSIRESVRICGRCQLHGATTNWFY